MVGHNGIFEDYLDLGVRAVIDPQIRCYLEKTEDNTDNFDSYLDEAVYNLDLEGITTREEVTEDVVVVMKVVVEKVVVKKEEGTDDGKTDLSGGFGMCGSNFVVAGLVDEDADGETVIIKEEDDSTENTMHGIREAVSSFHLTGSVDEDNAAEEVVTIKDEEDIKREDNGTDTYAIGDAISNLHLAESTYDSPPADTPFVFQIPEIVFTPPSPSSSYGETSLGSDSDITASNQAYEEITDGINDFTDVSNQSMDGANELVDRPSPDESDIDPSVSSLGDGLALLEALAEFPVIKQESPSNSELTPMAPEMVMDFPRLENTAPAAMPTRPYRAILPKVIVAPQLEYYGIPGHYRWVNGASHFFPHGARDYTTEIEVSNSPEFRTGYATAIADRVFQPGPEFYRMTPDERRTYMADWIAGSTARGEDFARNPAPAIRGQAAVHNQAPMFQVTTDRHDSVRNFHHGHCSVANMASILPDETQVQNSGPYFQTQTAVHNPGSYFETQTPLHYPGSYFQTQTPLHNPGSYFQAQSVMGNPAPTFAGGNYSAPNISHFTYGDNHLTQSSTPLFRTQTPPHRATGIFNDTNYPTLNAGPVFRTNPFINDYTPNTDLTFQTPLTMDNPITAPIFRPAQCSFVNMTPADVQAQQMADQFANSSLEVPRTRQSTPIKTEDDVVIKTEPGRCQSDSIFERKRTRDVDTDEENEYWNIERPRKFSG